MTESDLQIYPTPSSHPNLWDPESFLPRLRASKPDTCEEICSEHGRPSWRGSGAPTRWEYRRPSPSDAFDVLSTSPTPIPKRKSTRIATPESSSMNPMLATCLETPYNPPDQAGWAV